MAEEIEHATQQPIACAVCRRRATELAYVTERRETLYLCGDPGCSAGAHRLKLLDFDELERKALGAAGASAGAWLDGIGKTDLGELSGEQWTAFLALVVTGFSDRLRELVLSENPPF